MPSSIPTAGRAPGSALAPCLPPERPGLGRRGMATRSGTRVLWSELCRASGESAAGHGHSESVAGLPNRSCGCIARCGAVLLVKPCHGRNSEASTVPRHPAAPPSHPQAPRHTSLPSQPSPPLWLCSRTHPVRYPGGRALGISPLTHPHSQLSAQLGRCQLLGTGLRPPAGNQAGGDSGS